MKPKPFANSFWGIALVLIIAVVLLGINNYRTNKAGFNLTYAAATADQLKPARSAADTAYLFTNKADFDKVCREATTSKINWDKQVVLGYAITNINSGYTLKPSSVRRQGATVNINYQRTTPEDQPDRAFLQVISYPVELIILDRTKLIASGELTFNFILNGVTTKVIKAAPSQI